MMPAPETHNEGTQLIGRAKAATVVIGPHLAAGLPAWPRQQHPHLHQGKPLQCALAQRWLVL
jgi:hypothetical protein